MMKEEVDFISGMNMCDEISNEAYKKIMCHCEEQKSCEDAVSRKEIQQKINRLWNSNGDKDYCMETLRDFVTELPPVTPTRKKGKWIKSNIGGAKVCSICQAHMGLSNFRYCPNCGADMRGEEI